MLYSFFVQNGIMLDLENSFQKLLFVFFVVSCVATVTANSGKFHLLPRRRSVVSIVLNFRCMLTLFCSYCVWHSCWQLCDCFWFWTACVCLCIQRVWIFLYDSLAVTLICFDLFCNFQSFWMLFTFSATVTKICGSLFQM